MPHRPMLYPVHGRSEAAARAALSRSVAALLAQRQFAPPPAPELISAQINLAGWTKVEFAEQLGVSLDAVRRWTTSTQGREYEPIPYAAWVLALLLSGHVTVEDLRR